LVKQNNTTVANYDWKADGILDKVTYQNSTSRNYVYDSADRVSSITNSFGNDQSETFGYGYDANSNRITETKAATNQVTKSINYQYDSLDRLSQVKTTTPTTSQIDYTYDAVGNRRTEIGVDQYGNNVNRTASYDDLNQLKTLANGNITESFNYDDNGNLVETKLNDSPVTKFEYDIRNQLSKYTGVGNGVNVTFDYDFERKRTSKTFGSITTNYTYAGSQVVNETQNNAISASYTIGGGEIVKSEFVANGESNYHFTDALGSVTSLTNNLGSLTSRSDYDAFGLQTGGSGSSNSIGYTGQRLDNETGLMALGNGERYYSPSYARFIQQDSFAGLPNMPQSLNRFAYGLNNPNKHTDPSGHIAPLVIAGIVGAVVGGVLGAAYSYEMQNAQIADGLRSPDQFSWGEVIWGGAVGAVVGAVGGIAGAAAIMASPIALPLIVASGVITSATQIIKGHYEASAGYKNVGYVDKKYGVIGVLLSFIGLAGGRGPKNSGKATVLEENVTPTSGAKEVPLTTEPPSQAPKQISDGGRGSQKLLSAAPDEVVNTQKPTRFVGDENGGLSGGRGNANSVGKQGPIEVKPTLDNVRVGVKEVVQENLSQIKEIAPDAKVGYRGSLARGTKHQEKGGGDFEPTNFGMV
jgi:RHS repeat-associated protein